jgi:hypothetical protein
VAEQRNLLEEMLAQAEISIKELGERVIELESGQDLVALEGTILESVLRLGASLMGLVLTSWAANLAAKAGTRRPCVCGCGRMASWVGLRAKTILTLLGKVTYRRVYYHCEHLSTVRPRSVRTARLWGISSGAWSTPVPVLASSPPQADWATSARVRLRRIGFSAAARLVCRTLHWPEQWLSGKQVQRLAEPIGTRLGEAETARIARWWKVATMGLSAQLTGAASLAYEVAVDQAQGRCPERLYVQADGTMARLRGILGKGSDVFREVKVGAVFWATTGRHASKLLEFIAKRARGTANGTANGLKPVARTFVDVPKGPITYVAGLLTAADFGVQLYAEAVRRGVERAQQVVILGDGALWIWKLAEEHFPGAIQILDFWHASQHVWKVAQAVWGQGSARTAEWAEAVIANHLIIGDVVGLLAAIRALPTVAPEPGEQKSVPEHALDYFQSNAPRMRYLEYRASGMEIGSGTVESAGKRVVGQRCKAPGMRWSEEGLTAILNLRTNLLNDRYDLALADLKEAA